MPPLRTGFQSFVNNELPIAVPGDFASVNPRASVVAGPGQYVAPEDGTTVGVFAWFDPSTGIASNYYKPNSFLGFVHRENQGLITLFLGIATMEVVPGNMVTGMNQGDFYGIFLAGATVGQKVYADPVTGGLTANTTGESVTGSYTGTTVTGGVATFTTADLTGTAAAVGQVVTGGTLPEGTYIASSAGTGSGTLLFNLANLNGLPIPNQTAFVSTEYGVQETNFSVASAVSAGASVTASIAVTGIMTVTAVGSGVLEAGQWLTGTGLPSSANAQILYQLPGGTPGGNGTYQTSYNAVIASETIVASEGQVGAITSWGQAGVA